MDRIIDNLYSYYEIRARAIYPDHLAIFVYYYYYYFLAP
jgi:hypothetical protein